MKGFKPFGLPPCKKEKVTIKFEEYESIKLIDYDQLSQDQAAEKMNVSRPTFTRIYNKALKTVAKAFVEGRSIEIDGGCYQFESDWYRCQRCFKLIKGLENHSKCKNCCNYGVSELIYLGQGSSDSKE
jgi:uncharacterized protein